MKLINNAAIGVCLFVSISAKAQQTDNDTTTKFTPPVIVKDKDSVQKSENKKEEYKSEEWRQGEEITDTTHKSSPKHRSDAGKKTKKRVPPSPAPPPPPPAIPAKP